MSCNSNEHVRICNDNLTDKIENQINKQLKNSNFGVNPKVCHADDSLYVELELNQKELKEYVSHTDFQKLISSYIMFSNYSDINNFSTVVFNIYLDKEKDQNHSIFIYPDSSLNNSYKLFNQCENFQKSALYLIENSKELDFYHYDNTIEILNNSVYKNQVINTKFVDLLYKFMCINDSSDSKISKTFRGIFLTLLAKPEEYMNQLNDINTLYQLKYREDLFTKNNVSHLKLRK